MNSVLEDIGKYGIIPVVVIEKEEDAIPLAEALIEGGLPVAEVTFRTKAAKNAMKIISEKYPDMLLGAGTVLNGQQVEDAIEGGAKFIVSPGLNPNTVRYCQDKGITIIPGCSNASDIEQAIELGLSTVKFFPAEPAGGLPMIKALSAPYCDMTFMPTGGINKENVKEYLKFNKIIACGGSWMVKGSLIENGEFDKIKELTKEAVEIVKRNKI